MPKLLWEIVIPAVFALNFCACNDFSWHGSDEGGDMESLEISEGDSDREAGDLDSSADGDKVDSDFEPDPDKEILNESEHKDGDNDPGEVDADCVELDTDDKDSPDAELEFEIETADSDTADSAGETDWTPDFICAGNVCEDSDTGFKWQENGAANPMNYSSAVSYCQNLETDGGGWRLPNISELRTLVRNCAALQTGGGCGVQDVCPPCGVYSGDACLILATCKGLNCAPSACPDNGGPDGCYLSSELGGTCGWFWSMSQETLNTCAYSIDFYKGELICSAKTSSSGYARCVK